MHLSLRSARATRAQTISRYNTIPDAPFTIRTMLRHADAEIAPTHLRSFIRVKLEELQRRSFDSSSHSATQSATIDQSSVLRPVDQRLHWCASWRQPERCHVQPEELHISMRPKQPLGTPSTVCAGRHVIIIVKIVSQYTQHNRAKLPAPTGNAQRTRSMESFSVPTLWCPRLSASAPQRPRCTAGLAAALPACRDLAAAPAERPCPHCCLQAQPPHRLQAPWKLRPHSRLLTLLPARRPVQLQA